MAKMISFLFLHRAFRFWRFLLLLLFSFIHLIELSQVIILLNLILHNLWHGFNVHLLMFLILHINRMKRITIAKNLNIHLILSIIEFVRVNTLRKYQAFSFFTSKIINYKFVDCGFLFCFT